MAGTLVDIRDVVQGLDKMGRVADREAAIYFRELIPDAKQEIRENRRGLQRRAKATVESHGRGRTLGKVPTQYRWRAAAWGLDGLSRVSYSGVLDEGGAVGNRAKLPSRPYARLKPPFVRKAADGYAAFAVRRGWG